MTPSRLDVPVTELLERFQGLTGGSDPLIGDRYIYSSLTGILLRRALQGWDLSHETASRT